MTALLERTWQIGDLIGPLSPGTVDRTTIALFAGGSGDHNPIHLDSDIARHAGMDDVFAQGMLSMAFLGRLLTDTFGQQAVQSFTTRFTAITPVNATPSCHGEITEITNCLATVQLTVKLADGTQTLQGTALIDLARTTEGSLA